MNKFALFLVTLLNLTITSAASPIYRDYNHPLLLKETTSGFVPEHMEFTSRCEIYATHYKLVTKRQGKTYITMKKLVLPADIQEKIETAADAEITYQQAPADIGNRIYLAQLNLTAPEPTIIDLGSTRDSQTISTNNSESATELKQFLDETCIQ
jgi:hypothetical protein